MIFIIFSGWEAACVCQILFPLFSTSEVVNVFLKITDIKHICRKDSASECGRFLATKMRN